MMNDASIEDKVFLVTPLFNLHKVSWEEAKSRTQALRKHHPGWILKGGGRSISASLRVSVI
jgi:hypothetical protein